jgi:hypothetical protein
MNPEDPKLESLLRESLAQPELPDGGFTARVLATLPPTRAIAHYRAWLACGWAGSMASVGVALAVCLPWGDFGNASSALGPSPSGLASCAWTAFALAAALAGGVAAWYLREFASEA